jgi:hypothetical protein
MLEASCFRCHGEDRQKGERRLDSREALLKGGENGKIIDPGYGTKSIMLFAAAQVNDDGAMPPKRRSGGPGGPGGPGAFQPPPEMIKKYDKDGDGKLNDAERQAMMAEFQAQRGGQKVVPVVLKALAPPTLARHLRAAQADLKVVVDKAEDPVVPAAVHHRNRCRQNKSVFCGRGLIRVRSDRLKQRSSPREAHGIAHATSL